MGINPYNAPVSSFLRFGCCNSDTESADLSRFSATEVGSNCGSDFRSILWKIELKSVLTNSSRSLRLNISSWVTTESHSFRSQILVPTSGGGLEGGALANPYELVPYSSIRLRGNCSNGGKTNWFLAQINTSMSAPFSRFSTLQTLIEHFEQVSTLGIIAYLARLEIKAASFAHSYAPSGLYQLVVSLMSMVLNSLDFSKHDWTWLQGSITCLCVIHSSNLNNLKLQC